MSNGATAIPSDETALDLIRAFVESNDAYLRGNAVHALAVVASSGTNSRAIGAEDLLVRALAAGPASVEPEWQRRFQARALDALRELDVERRNRILQRVLMFEQQSTDEIQQTAISNFLLQAMAAGLFFSNSWVQLKRLAASVGAPKFWAAVWAVAWRSAIALFAVFLLVAITPSDIRSDVFMMTGALLDLYWGFLVLLSILTLLSFVGRLKIPLKYRVADIAASGVVMALLCIGGTARVLANTNVESPKDFAANLLESFTQISARNLLALAALGFAVGASVRLMRWLSDAKMQVGYRFRPIWAILEAAVFSIAAFYFGMDARIAAAAALTVVPAAGVLAALDIWLERLGPNLPGSAVLPNWSWIGLLVVTVLLFVIGGYVNISHGWTHLKSLQQSAVLQISLPQDLSSGEIVRESFLPVQLSVNVTEEDRYLVRASPSAKEHDIILVIENAAKTYTKRIDKDGPDNREEFKDRLSPDTYAVCARLAGIENCGTGMGLVGLAAILIAGTTGLEDTPREKRLVRINISRE